MSIISKRDLDFYLPNQAAVVLKTLRQTEVYKVLEQKVSGTTEDVDNLVEFVGEIMYRYGMQETFALAAYVSNLAEDGIVEYQDIYSEILKKT